ncbi:CPBP family intramembrane metalloprotease [Candidatus Saccharibacteria bacterium]|nr:CPBP family intramembrane metalloprotease [Candidatus Saccharibacteria bacterium]
MEKAPKVLPKKESRKTGWKFFLKILALLIWVWASVYISQMIIGYSLFWILGAETLSQPVWTAVYSALSYVVAMLLIILIPIKLKKKTKDDKKEHKNKEKYREQLGLRELPTWTDIGLAPVGFIVYVLIAAGFTALFSLFPWFNANEAQDVGFSIYMNGADRVIAFITLAVIAPIAEEIIFRGWLYGKLRKKISEKYNDKISMAISIFLVSLLFGIMHGQWNVGVNVFAMSVILCGLREITGTIYAGILMHMIKNGIAFYLLYVLGM